jgi:hypothetical protein
MRRYMGLVKQCTLFWVGHYLILLGTHRGDLSIHVSRMHTHARTCRCEIACAFTDVCRHIRTDIHTHVHAILNITEIRGIQILLNGRNTQIEWIGFSLPTSATAKYVVRYIHLSYLQFHSKLICNSFVNWSSSSITCSFVRDDVITNGVISLYLPHGRRPRYLLTSGQGADICVFHWPRVCSIRLSL